MANSSGFFPAQLHRPRQRHRNLARLAAVFLWPFLSLGAAGAPDYLSAALASFSPEVPSHWAYSLTTERAGVVTTERFDPSKPAIEQWTLLATAGLVSTEAEREKYFKYKASQTPGALKATFQRSDIEPGSIRLIREGPDRAEFSGTFREQSAGADKMLAHLQLTLIINKRRQRVERYSLTLIAPYSPILGVKMNELVVTMDFSPSPDAPINLPSASSSHFTGRIFFFPIEENIRYRYYDFTTTP